MFRESRIGWTAPIAAGLLLLAAPFAPAQERRNNNTSRIDVQQYTIDAEISPNTQSIAAKTTVRFVPVDDGVTSASFELWLMKIADTAPPGAFVTGLYSRSPLVIRLNARRRTQGTRAWPVRERAAPPGIEEGSCPQHRKPCRPRTRAGTPVT